MKDECQSEAMNSDDNQETAPVSDITDEIYQLTMQRRIQREAGRLREKATAVVGFDAQRYEKAVELCLPRNTIRLTASSEHREMLQDFYVQLELSTSAFHALREQSYEEFHEYLKNGCYVDRFLPKPNEEKVLKQLNPHYVSSGDELQAFLSGAHPRCAIDDFRAWGHVDDSGMLMAMTAAWLPPKGDRLERHTEYLEKYFTKSMGNGARFTPKAGANIAELLKRASTTAEFFMIGGLPEVKGVGPLAYAAMLEQPEVKQAMQSNRITDWYLSRFSTIIQKFPVQDARISPDDENEGSRSMFRKLGYGTLGTFHDPNQLAARELSEGDVVVVNPIWSVAHAEVQETIKHTASVVSELARKAKQARLAATID